MYHISTNPNLTVLEPRTPDDFIDNEVVESCVSASESWYFCVALMPESKWQSVYNEECDWYLYECPNEPFVKAPAGAEDSEFEFRAYAPVPCKLLGKIDIEHKLFTYARFGHPRKLVRWRKLPDTTKLIIKEQ